jgi:hypothetical protein
VDLRVGDAGDAKEPPQDLDVTQAVGRPELVGDLCSWKRRA